MTDLASPGTEAELEQYRRELTGYCYRMLGSGFEAEDAVQDTLVRAWKNLDTFEGRSSLRSWLYKIATNVCLDMRKAGQRRARPMDLGPAQSADTPLPAPLPELTWMEPIPDAHVINLDSDPAEVAVERESIRLAFVTALQRLPANQRAVLVLREVLRWKAEEVAELFETSVASVNSALQRARATLADTNADEGIRVDEMDDGQKELLARYVDAFERYDMDALTSVLSDDATWSMPPFDLWLQTHDDIVKWCLGTGAGCEDSQLIPTIANGQPAFGQYKPDPEGGWAPWSLQVVEIEGDQIVGLSFFLDTENLFPLFGLPPRLDEDTRVQR